MSDRRIIKFLKDFQIDTLRGVATGKPVNVRDYLERFKEIGVNYAEFIKLDERAESNGNLGDEPEAERLTAGSLQPLRKSAVKSAEEHYYRTRKVKKYGTKSARRG